LFADPLTLGELVPFVMKLAILPWVEELVSAAFFVTEVAFFVAGVAFLAAVLLIGAFLAGVSVSAEILRFYRKRRHFNKPYVVVFTVLTA
jgi:hypothetical protein